MQPKNKKIILIAVTAAAAIGVFLFAPFGTQLSLFAQIEKTFRTK